MTPENDISTDVLSNEGGKIVFAPDVVATIAGLAAAEVKGVKVEVGTEETAIDLSVVIEYGYRIHEVCSKVQQEVKNAVETMTGLRVVRVNMFVQAINFAKPEDKQLPESGE